MYTVLYVEDDSTNRLLMRRILLSEGFLMIEASNAEEALEVMSSHKPDLILMDMNMPDIDGYTLTSQIRNMLGSSSLPIVALTANAMPGDRERSITSGCSGYIQKPYDVDILPGIIRSYLQEVPHG